MSTLETETWKKGNEAICAEFAAFQVLRIRQSRDKDRRKIWGFLPMGVQVTASFMNPPMNEAAKVLALYFSKDHEEILEIATEDET